jgi:ABC-type antimicrobial peptide transport system permease subunit
VFAIGCVNISNLMLARGLRRRRDLDVRLALGATRAQILAFNERNIPPPK